MGGIDLFDHFRSSYPINRKSRKFWIRLFIFMFDSSITTYIVNNKSHRQFRLKLVRSLIANYTTKKHKTTIFKNKKGRHFGVPDKIRLLNVGIHMPEEIETSKRCRFYSTKKYTKTH